MNYQEFIKNIYTSLKSINLKQQKIEEHFQLTFQKIDDLDSKVNTVSNKLDDFIDASNRLKQEKSIALSNSLNNIADNLSTIQTEQDDILTTMTDVRNIEENMTVLLDDFLSREQIVNDDLQINMSSNDNIPIKTNTTIKETNNTLEDTNTIKEDTNPIKEDTNLIKEETINKKEGLEITSNTETMIDTSQVLQSLDLNHESEDELLILE